MDNIKPYPSIPVALIGAGDMCLPPTKFITTNVHNLVCPIAFLSRSRTVYVMNLFFFFFFFNEQSKITVYDYVVRKQYKDIHCNHSDQYTFNLMLCYQQTHFSTQHAHSTWSHREGEYSSSLLSTFASSRRP